METNEKILVFLLWLIGGFIGLHQFYLGNKKQGFVLFTFCAVTVLFTFIGIVQIDVMSFLLFFPVLFYFVLITDLLRTLRS